MQLKSDQIRVYTSEDLELEVFKKNKGVDMIPASESVLFQNNSASFLNPNISLPN